MYTLEHILKYSNDTQIVSHGNIIFIGDEKKSVFVNQLISESGKEKIDNLLIDTLYTTIKSKYHDVEEVYADLNKGVDSFIVYSSNIPKKEDVELDDFYKRKNYVLLHLGKIKATPINNANKYFFQTERMTQKNIKQSSLQKEAAGHEIWVHDKPISYEDFGVELEIVWFRNAMPSNTLNIVNVQALNDLKKQKEEISKEINNTIGEPTPELLKKEQQIDDLIEEFKVDAGFDKAGFEDIIKSNYTKKEVIKTNEFLSFQDGTLKFSYIKKYVTDGNTSVNEHEDDISDIAINKEYSSIEELKLIIDDLYEDIKKQIEKLKELDQSPDNLQEKEDIKNSINKNKELLTQYYKDLDELKNTTTIKEEL